MADFVKGKYVCDVDLDIIMSLDVIVSGKGEGTKTHAGWADGSTTLSFKAGKIVVLNDEQVKNPTIQHLISKNVLRRVY